MTNFDYYIKGGRADEGCEAWRWREFQHKKWNFSGLTTLDRYNEWLLEEHEEPILDDIEKEYLSNVIKPFRSKVSSIAKKRDVEFNPTSEVYYIDIQINDGKDFCFLPSFKPSTGMYKNMVENRKYTLKELNL